MDPLFSRLRLSYFGLFRVFPVALYRDMRSWRGACWKTIPKCRQIDDIRWFVRAEEVIWDISIARIEIGFLFSQVTELC